MRNLHASAPDVDHHSRRARDVDAVDSGEVDEAGFLGSGDHLGLDSSLPLDRGEEFLAVFRLADGTGGGSQDFFDLVRFREAAEAGKGLEAGGHGLLGQRSTVQAPGAEPHHFLLAIDDFERQIGPDPHHDHVNRIRPTVDRRYPHLVDLKGFVGFIRTSYNGGEPSAGAAPTSLPNPNMNVRTSYDSLWLKRLDALSASWPEFLAGHPDALHKARVASRRLRAALPVVGASLSPAKVKKLRRTLRDMTRWLGPIRELDVELALLEQGAAGEAISGSALTLVRRELAARRQALRDRLGDEPPVADLKKLIKKLERVAEAKGKRRSALAATLLRRAKRLKSALDEAGPLYAPERLHSARIATKKLRYGLEIAQDAGEVRARGLVNVLKREQERLGHLHDLQALLKHVREAASSPRVGSRLADLTAYADGLERDCRQLHAQFVEHRDAMFKCVQEVRHRLVPALTTADLRPAHVTRLGKPDDRRTVRALPDSSRPRC